MFTLRHRLSNFMGLREDSTADSEASTRALRGSMNSSDTDVDVISGWRARKESDFSADSGYQSTAASNLEEASYHEQASPGKLKKAASTTFQAFSNSLRSKTQLFYSNTEAARLATPQRSKNRTPERLREGATLWSSTRKRVGRSPRSAPGDAFTSPRRSKSRDSATPNLDSNAGSPRSINRRSSLWLSIKERANRSPRSSKENPLDDEDSPTSLRSPIDDLAPSLDVDIPDSVLTVSQLLQRSKSRSRAASPLSTGIETKDVDYRAQDVSKEAAPATNIKFPPTVKAMNRPTSRPRGQFLESIPSRVALPHSPINKKRPNLVPTPVEDNGNPAKVETVQGNDETDEPNTSPRPAALRTTSFGNGLKDLGFPSTESGDNEAEHCQPKEPPNSLGNGSRFVGQGTLTASPDPPSMGSRNVWDQARADRDSRYFALEAPETDVDSESDSCLELVLCPGKDTVQTSSPSGAIAADSSPHKPKAVRGDLQYAVEAIERSPGKVFDDSSSSETEASPQRPDFGGDLHYAVEAIKRPPGTAYDHSTSSSSIHSPQKSKSLESSPNVAVKAIRELHGTRSEQQRSDGPPLPGKSEQSAREGLSAQLLEEVKTPLVEVDHPAAEFGSPSSTDSMFTTESCAVTTHDPLCYAPPPYPSLHMRSSPVGRTLDADEASEKPKSGEDDGPVSQQKTSTPKLHSPTSVLDQSPWSELLFDSDMNMKLTAEPLTPDRSRASAAVDPQPKLTNEPLTPNKPQMLTPAEVPLPATPFPASGTFDLPIRLKGDQSPPDRANVPKENQKSPTMRDEVDHSETPSNPAKLPIFDEPFSPPRYKKKSFQRKKSLKKLSLSKKDARVLAEASGNSGKQYSWSQIVKGDRQVDTLKESIKDIENNDKASDGNENKGNNEAKADAEIKSDLKVDESKAFEEHQRTSSHKKGVWWAREDEIIGCADPPSPVLERKRLVVTGEHLKKASPEGFAGTQESIKSSTDERGAVDGVGAMKPWDDKAKNAVAKHLMSVVYDIEREANTGNEVERVSDEE